jgi:hypothetical protein
VLPFARAALDAVANARLAVDDLAGLVRGQVTVGMVSGITDPQLRSRLELAWRCAPAANPAARALIEQARALGPPGRSVP